ncbi:MAG: hypothetical protein MK086_05490 [Flavobacteriales bacterium]|nr:hypothetical protein [Flavobacteriales bacterium]
MKHFAPIIILLLSVLSVSAQKNAQSRGGETFETFDNYNPKKDLHCGYDKPLQKSERAALVAGNLHFKTITRGAVLLGKGQGRETVESWAMLQGVSDETMQEIADEFAVMFEKKLAAVTGIMGVPSEDLKLTEAFGKLTEKTTKTEDTGNLIGQKKVKSLSGYPYNRWNLLKSPGIHSKMAKQVQADVYQYDIVIDFVRFGIEASRWTVEYDFLGYDEINTKTSADILPAIGIKVSDSADRMKIVQSSFSLTNEKNRQRRSCLCRTLP